MIKHAETRMLIYLLKTIAWTTFVAALIFWPAGTVNYPAAWVLLGLFVAGSLGMIVWLSKSSPELLRERMSSPIQRAQAPWDRVWLTIFMVAFCGWLMLMGWDARRTHFSAIPPWLQAAGALAILLNFAGTFWTFRENAFAAPVVKIQETQKVIDTGPYALVRHPMYTSTIFFFLGIPLLLGSWLGVLAGPAMILAVAWRAVHEEEALRAQLPGYADYAARVRYRLIPHVW